MTSCILSTCKGYARQVARPSCPPHGSCVSVLSTPPAASGEHMNRIRSTCTVSSYHLEDGRRPCSEPLPRIVDHHQRMGYREARPQWRFPGMGPPFLYPFASSTVVDKLLAREVAPLRIEVVCRGRWFPAKPHTGNQGGRGACTQRE